MAAWLEVRNTYLYEPSSKMRGVPQSKKTVSFFSSSATGATARQSPLEM